MNLMDYILLATVPFCIIYGFRKGLRPALWLLVALLGIVLANYFFVGLVERIFLTLGGVKASNYPNAPGVAVLLLNNKPVWAGFAALAPAFIAFIIYVASRILGWLINNYILAPPALNKQTRMGGVITGLFTAVVLCFLIVIQFDRLPWVWSGELVGKSLIIDKIHDLFPYLTGQLSDGKLWKN